MNKFCLLIDFDELVSRGSIGRTAKVIREAFGYSAIGNEVKHMLPTVENFIPVLKASSDLWPITKVTVIKDGSLTLSRNFSASSRSPERTAEEPRVGQCVACGKRFLSKVRKEMHESFFCPEKSYSQDVVQAALRLEKKRTLSGLSFRSPSTENTLHGFCEYVSSENISFDSSSLFRVGWARSMGNQKRKLPAKIKSALKC